MPDSCRARPYDLMPSIVDLTDLDHARLLMPNRLFIEVPGVNVPPENAPQRGATSRYMRGDWPHNPGGYN